MGSTLTAFVLCLLRKERALMPLTMPCQIHCCTRDLAILRLHDGFGSVGQKGGA